MGSISTGGGSTIAAGSAHAGCARYRHTDPMLIGISRRELAKSFGHPDTSAGIPEARWMRAMTFESLVRHDRFVSQLLTTAVGRLDLARPKGVRRADAKVSVATTATALQQAHLKAMHEGVATMVTGLALPFVGMEQVAGATPVKPDFAIVVPRLAAAAPEGTRPTGTWLVMGDAKDYERIRSRIDDQRMLKGFLQVAVGAVSAEAWSKLPKGMTVHTWGALAVPRNAFLQPVAVVEDLRDHRAEVLTRVAEREHLRADLAWEVVPAQEVHDFVRHQEMAYDPATCRACALHNSCRAEVQGHAGALWRLVELGVPVAERGSLLGLADGTDDGSAAPPATAARVRASLSGRAELTGKRRTDPLGLPGTVNLVLAKSDAAALGVHGLATRTVTASGAGTWHAEVFEDPQSSITRLAVMEALGAALEVALGDRASAAAGGSRGPVHVVVPDTATGDVLVSIADSLAGVEISRLRWARDLERGRPALTFNGEPAVVPEPLTDRQRLAVSFLLDEDRNRALSLRMALVDARGVLAGHFVVGGAAFEALRLDYVVRWGEAEAPLDHRAVSDDVAAEESTPGARLGNRRSDAIHKAGRRGRVDADRYRSLVEEELAFKQDVLDRAVALLAPLDVSALRPVHRALEGDAQAVWRRRWSLHASDLVRFGRVQWWWRNDQVDQLDQDTRCARQVTALGNPLVAYEMAADAGTREVALATVVQSVPLRLAVRSRSLGDGSVVHLAHSELGPSVERAGVTLKIQVTSFKFSAQPVGTLKADDRTELDGSLAFVAGDDLGLSVGSEVVLLDGTWISTFARGADIAVKRPGLDTNSAPKATCADGDYAADPENHKYCCQPHESREADTSDYFAKERASGRMNPEVWPPLVDVDAFDVPAIGTPTDSGGAVPGTGIPVDLTIDDLD